MNALLISDAALVINEIMYNEAQGTGGSVKSSTSFDGDDWLEVC